MMSERKVISLEEGWDFMQASCHSRSLEASVREPGEASVAVERPRHVTSQQAKKKKSLVVSFSSILLFYRPKGERDGCEPPRGSGR